MTSNFVGPVVSSSSSLSNPGPGLLAGAIHQRAETLLATGYPNCMIETNDAQKLGRLVFDPGGSNSSASLATFSEEEVIGFRSRGQAILDEPMISGKYSDSELDMSLIDCDRMEFERLGLRSFIEERTEALRWSGCPREVVEAATVGFEYQSVLLDLMANGVRSFVKPTFVPNGGHGYTQSKSYFEHRECCNKHMFKLRSEGRALLIKWDTLTAHEQSLFNLNRLQLAAKTGKPEGRCCLNASSTIKYQGEPIMSLNDGMDREASDKYYVPTVLPTLAGICQMAQGALSKSQEMDDTVVGATIDVAGAYNQFTLSFEASLHRAVMIYLGDQKIPYVCVILVNNFGDARAGHVYNIAGTFIDWHHNQLRDRSKTYIDDGVMIDIRKLIEASRADYRVPIHILFGISGIAEPKDVFMEQDLVALGWHFNLRDGVWRVSPKKRAIEKMYAMLFILLPGNCTDHDVMISVTRRQLHSLASILSWYSAVLKVGRPFVHAVFKNVGYGNLDHKVILSPSCKNDIAWWRAIITMTMRDPHFMSSRINDLVPDTVCDCEITTDASLHIGGGAWLSSGGLSVQQAIDGIISFESITIEREGFIRWTPEELEIFDRGIAGSDDGNKADPISINVLEFFTVIYFVMLWGPSLKGKRIRINCDNTAAISWLLKSRGSNKSPVAESLVKIFVLYCLALDITLVPWHIPGKLNRHADDLSRLLNLQEEQITPWAIDTKTENWWRGLSREACCRQLLIASIVTPSAVPLPQVLQLLQHLL